MTRRVSQGLTALCAAVVVALLGSGSPHSETIDHSENDGLWSTSLEGPMFDRNIRWVPGDTRTAEFRVRNGTDEDGNLSIHVDGPDSVRAESFSVGLGSAMARCADIVIPAGSERAVVATVHMSDLATDETQKKQAELDVALQWGEGGATSPCVPAFDETKDGER